MATAKNVTHGNVRVDKVNVTSDNKSTSDVLALAATVWEEVRGSGVDPKDEKENDRYLTRLRAKYSDFAKTFPVVFRWMVQTKEYEAKAFERFLKTKVKVMYADRKEFLAAQAEYLVLLYKQRNPRSEGKKVVAYRAAVIKMLEKDEKIFMEAKDQIDDEVKKLDETIVLDRKRRLVEFLKAQKSSD